MFRVNNRYRQLEYMHMLWQKQQKGKSISKEGVKKKKEEKSDKNTCRNGNFFVLLFSLKNSAMDCKRVIMKQNKRAKGMYINDHFPSINIQKSASESIYELVCHKNLLAKLTGSGKQGCWQLLKRPDAASPPLMGLTSSALLCTSVEPVNSRS